ncbi:hypothetical protein WMY93_014311 [Mugilogobius chulae]|uniref:USP domain-containing protein n=1 Tax=Mugilogobius chulae TaxID=88201 RepID=A0AAW0P5S0_9GOBI
MNNQPAEVREPRDKYYGLVNQGATCSLNCVLQVLFMNQDFRERVTSHARTNPEPKYIDSELSELFLELETKLACTYKITNKLKINNVKEQRDAADIYEKILRLTSPGASQIFHGKLTNNNICLKCQDKTESEAGFWHLPLPVGNNDDYSVEKGIVNFFGQSLITGDNQMYCETCDEKCDAVLECEMTDPPEVLVLLIKRFEFDYAQGKYMKICHGVDVPLILNIQNQIYELRALVEHLGEERFGRYVATIKGHFDGRWYTFDDTHVTESRNQYFQGGPTERSQTAYLLFYQRRKVAKYNGLLNLGATCYLNSVLQVLFMTEDFRKSVKTDLFSDLEQHWAYTYNITKKLNITNVHEQRDAAEYYENILRLSSPEAAQIFHGELKHISTCQDCGGKIESTSRFWHLPLSLVNTKDKGFSVLESILDFFVHREVQVYCDTCGKTDDAVLDCELTHYPEVLVLLMKRFDYDKRQMRNVKNNTAVLVPQTLKIPLNYELYACVEHYGELQFGHYIAKIISKDERRLYTFDDMSVAYKEIQELPTEWNSQAAYLLFYRKQKDPSDRHVRQVSSSQTEGATAEPNKDNKDKEKEEESISNAFTLEMIVGRLLSSSDETNHNDEEIHCKMPREQKVQENNPSHHEERSEIKETGDVDSLVDFFDKMRLTNENDSNFPQAENGRHDEPMQTNVSQGFSERETREEKTQSEITTQNWDQSYDEHSGYDSDLGACALAEVCNLQAFNNSLMDFERCPIHGFFESDPSEMPADLSNYKLKLTMRQNEREGAMNVDCLEAEVANGQPEEANLGREPYHVHYSDAEEDEATKKFIREEQKQSPLPPNSRSNSETETGQRRRATSYKGRFNGVESLGTTKEGDTEILKFMPTRRQSDEQRAGHEQNESDSSDHSGTTESSQDPEANQESQV